MNKSNDKILLNRIANHLIINSSFLDNLGLFHGKMGIVIFFYHYSRYTNNLIYEEFAGELLDEILEEIHDKLPIDFENGYLGIGWGIEYLFEQKFIDGDTNDILVDIDKKVMERDVGRISDMSLDNGLEGVFHYVLSRLRNNEYIAQLFDKEYFDDLFKASNNIENERISESLLSLIYHYYQCIISKKSNYKPLDYFSSFYCKTTLENNKVYDWKLGLVNGCAGIGLNCMDI